VGTSSSRQSHAVANAPSLPWGLCRCRGRLRERHRIFRPIACRHFQARLHWRSWACAMSSRYTPLRQSCHAVMPDGGIFNESGAPRRDHHSPTLSSLCPAHPHLGRAVVSPSKPYAGAAVSTVRPSLFAEAVDNGRRHRAVIKHIGVTGGRRVSRETFGWIGVI
jgi:hypothetical protein